MNLAPWLQQQLCAVRALRGHAILLDGPAGLGQLELAEALAQTWLCERPSEQGACGTCPSCHALQVRAHADVFALMPERLALERGWPLDAATQERIDRKEIKPGRQIRVEATRAAVAFAQLSSAREQGKVILILSAERLNVESANTLLKTLEEPPGRVRFVLATEAAHQLLPTIRSRCQRYTLTWPSEAQGQAWLQAAGTAAGLRLTEEDWQVCWRAAGGRPQEALNWAQCGLRATVWRALPQQLVRGDGSALSDWPPSRQLQMLMLLCHDALALACGAPPRYFDADAVPRAQPERLWAFWRSLQQGWRHAEHPFHAGLWAEAWTERARAAFTPAARAPTTASSAALHSRP
ncbi:DNA polymerase III subunit delta' [Tepidimonas charontis]|uniref:DNA polymerase III subunit tau n=1 Tax=Tepidimonas charontis TaxID=2267262 RepID=A0A554XI99_9BURK|nr:DNA polymerase III subunit delta' [Tepidimonas charontis]TSE35543.1 DNA polymerase III subunit tau [Tepidimonas charontis]